MKKTALHGGEICCLAASLTVFRIFTNLPLVFTRISGTGAPLSALLSGLIVLVLLFFVLTRCKGQSIISSTKNTFAGYTVSVLALIYLASSALYTLTEFSQFAKATAFPTTPLWFVLLFFVVAAGVGAIKGIAPLLRLCRYFIPVFAAVVFLIILSVLWKCNPSNLFPLLGNGAVDTLGKGLSGILLYSDLFLLFLIDQPSANKNKVRRHALWGCFLGILVCFFTVLALTAKVPYPLSKDQQFPFYLLMKEVYYGRFLQRVDAVVLLISVLWGMLSLCLNLCLITKILEDTFEITSKSAVIFPLCALLFFLSIRGSIGIFPILVLSAAAFCALLIFLALFKKEARTDEK